MKKRTRELESELISPVGPIHSPDHAMDDGIDEYAHVEEQIELPRDVKPWEA